MSLFFLKGKKDSKILTALVSSIGLLNKDATLNGPDCVPIKKLQFLIRYNSRKFFIFKC